MLSLSGLFNVVCRVFNPGMLVHHDPINIVKTLVNMTNDDFCYIKTEVNDVQFYINRSSRIECLYLPFNIKGKECIFINIPIVGDNQALDIVYKNINKDAEILFYRLITRFFPHETNIVKKLYSWMTAFKLSEKLSMNINNFDDFIKKEIYINMANKLPYLLNKTHMPSTLFIDKYGAVSSDNIDKFIDLVSTDTEELFNSYLFTEIFAKDNIPCYKHFVYKSFIDD